MIWPESMAAKGISNFTGGTAQAITGAAPQTVNGNPVNGGDMIDGSLAAHVVSKVTTSTLTLTGKWQGKVKGGNWVDMGNGSQNAAGVAFQTGTGTIATVERIFPAPECAPSFSQVRFVITSGTGVGGGAGVDEIDTLDYYYRRPGF